MPAPDTRTFVIAAALRRLVIDSATGVVGYVKDPAAVLDFAFDWSRWLATASDPADTIASHTVAVGRREPENDEDPLLITELTKDSDAIDGGVVTVWLRGGVVPVAGAATRELPVTCRIVTTGGRADERSIWLQIAEA